MTNHIDKQRFKGTLTPKELEHLTSCRFCRDELVRQVETQEMLAAPKHLKSDIMEKSKRLDIQFIAGTNQISKKLQLFFFSLKVSAAVLCVLAMLTVTPSFSREFEHRLQNAAESSVIQKGTENQWNYYKKIENLTARLFELSNTNMEEYNYDAEKR